MKWEDILKECRTLDCYPVIKDFFSTCPPLIRNYLTLCPIPAGQLIIDTGAPCNTVYILISGRLQAIEENAGEIPYSFFDMVPFDIVGDYELFSEDTESFATIQAQEPSICLTLPASFYLQWIRVDSAALFFRVRLLMKQLSLQLNSSRRFLMMSYEQRCAYIICMEARKVAQTDGTCVIRLNREFLATRIGCSLRTVHRLVKELADQNYLQLTGGKILLTAGQLEAMKIHLGISDPLL